MRIHQDERKPPPPVLQRQKLASKLHPFPGRHRSQLAGARLIAVGVRLERQPEPPVAALLITFALVKVHELKRDQRFTRVRLICFLKVFLGPLQIPLLPRGLFVRAELPRHVAVAPDDSLVVAGGPEQAIHAYALTTGKSLARFGIEEHVPHTVAFSPDGRFIVSAGGGPFIPPRHPRESGALYVWGLEAGIQHRAGGNAPAPVR